MPNINLTGVEATANKSTNVNTDKASDTKYPSVKAVYDLVVGLFAKLSGATFTGNISAPNLSGTNTGDQDLSGYATTSALGNYLPLAGGTMDNGAVIIFDTVDIQSGGVNDYTQGWFYADGTSYASMGYNSTSDITAFDKQIIVRATDGSDVSGVVVNNFIANKNVALYSVSGANSASLIIDAISSAVYTNSSLNPINYNANYSANYTNRSLVDKEYVDTKLPIESPSTTGVALTFLTDRVYGSIGTPETGNITYSATGAKLGVTNIIIHNHSSAPTFAANMKKLSGSGTYVNSVVNYIYVTYINSTEVIYSINQRT